MGGPPEDIGIVKNLVGRLTTATAVKTTFEAVITTIHRAAGIDKPLEPRTKTQLPQATKMDSAPSSPRDDDAATEEWELVEPSGFLRSDAPAPESVIGDEYLDLPPRLASPGSEVQSPQIFKTESSKPTRVLPQITTGYIPAEDSSDPDEEYASFAPLKKIRKNRRGQRERQKIWEKRYGRNARHLQAQKALESKMTKERKKKFEKERKPNMEMKPQEAIGTQEVEQTRAKVVAPHPSWLAKQKMREKQKAMMDSVKPQKIVFS